MYMSNSKIRIGYVAKMKWLWSFNAKLLAFCNCVYLIDISELAVDVLAQFQQQAYRTPIENMQVEEQREQALGESSIL